MKTRTVFLFLIGLAGVMAIILAAAPEVRAQGKVYIYMRSGNMQMQYGSPPYTVAPGRQYASPRSSRALYCDTCYPDGGKSARRSFGDYNPPSAYSNMTGWEHTTPAGRAYQKGYHRGYVRGYHEGFYDGWTGDLISP